MGIPTFARSLAAMLLLMIACSTGSSQAAAPTPSSVYGGLPSVEDMSISPSGAGLAVVALIAGERQLLIFDAQREIRTRARLGDKKLVGIRWVGEDAVMVIMHETEQLGPEFTTDKVELHAAIIVSAGGGTPKIVFGNRSNMAKAVFGHYGTRFVNGQWVNFFAGVELAPSGDRMTYRFDNGRPALFRVDLDRNAPSKVYSAPPEGVSRRWLLDGTGEAAATLDLSYSSGRWEIKNRNGAMIASGIDLTGDVALVSLGRDGTTVIYAVEDDKNGLIRWIEVPLTGGEAKEVLEGIDIKRIYVDPTNGRLLGYLQGDGQNRPVLFDPAQQAAVAKVYRAFSKLDLQVVEWTPSLSHFLVHTSGNGDSGTWYVIDMAKLKADPIGYDYPAITPDAVGAISTFAYKAGDGMDLDGILTLPPGQQAKNLPIIIFPHGGPHAHDKAAFDWSAQAFASLGYAVFQPNFRGSTNRDDAFRRAGYGQWGRAMQTDLSDGLSALVKAGIADPKRACIVGMSYGGYAALAGVTLQQGIYRCAVAVAPVSDLGDMYWTDYRESGDNKMVKRSRIESLGDPKTYAQVSPRRFAARADAPVLLIHGKNDTVVPFKQSESMADALRNAHKPYEFVILREEDHWLSRSATRQQMLDAAISFVQRHNPPN